MSVTKMEAMDREKTSDTCILLDSLKGEISSIQTSTMDMSELLDNIWKYFITLKDELSTSSEAQNTVLQEKMFLIFESLNSFKDLMSNMKIETGRVKHQMNFISDSYQQEDENSTTLASETDSNHSDSQSDNEHEDEAKNFNVDFKIKTENEDDASDYTINLQSDHSSTLVEGKDNICVTPGKGIVSANSYTCVVCEEKFPNWQALNTHLDEIHIRPGSAPEKTQSLQVEKLNEIGDIRTHVKTGTAAMKDLTKLNEIGDIHIEWNSNSCIDYSKHLYDKISSEVQDCGTGSSGKKEKGLQNQAHVETGTAVMKDLPDRKTEHRSDRIKTRAHVETDTAVMKDLPDRKTEHRYDRIKTRGTISKGKHPNTKAQDPDSNVDPYGEEWPKDCGYCGVTFQSKMLYDFHTKVANSRCVRTFNCRYCSRTFTHRKGLRGHILNHHLKPEQATCDICGRVMARKRSLEQHKRTVHRGEKNFPCNQCDEKCTTKAVLRGHVQRVHENRRDHICDICGKGFHTSFNLNVHRASHNIEGIEHKCEDCGRVCTTALNLKRHYLRHTDPTIPCDFCDLKFHNQGDLTVHRRVHTGETPFDCENCGKKFTHSSSRRVHIRTCGKDPVAPRFPCKFCGKKFSDKHTAKLHMMKSCVLRPKDEQEVEKIVKELEANDSAFNVSKKYCGDVEPYRCSKCGKRFMMRTTMSRHESVCGIEAYLSCETCGKKFVEVWQLQRHMRFHLKQPRKRKIYVPKPKKEKPPPPPPKDTWNRKYSKEALVKAVTDVKDKTLSLVTASKKYGIPKTTLFDHAKGNVTHLIQGLKQYSAVLGKEKPNEEEGDDVNVKMEVHSRDSNGGDDCQVDNMEGQGVMGMEIDTDFKDVMGIKFHTSGLGPC